MSNKIITIVEFYDALKLISDYKLQLEDMIINIQDEKVEKIDLSKYLKPRQFNALSLYYIDNYNIKLEKEDLATMDVHYLKSINYAKLKRYRGFGQISEFKLMEIMNSNSILDK